MKILEHCPKLCHLNVISAQVGDQGLAYAASCREIRLLLLNGTNVTDVGIEPFQSFPSLQRLAVKQTKLTDAGLRPFLANKQLKELQLQGTAVTDDFIAEAKAALPDCKIPDFESVMPKAAATGSDRNVTKRTDTDREVAAWVHSIGGAVSISPTDGSLIEGKSSKLIPAGEQLPESFVVIGVHLQGNASVRSADLDRLIPLKRLQSLELTDTKLDSSAMERLNKLTALKYLWIAHTGIPGYELKHLTVLPYLAYLSLDHAQLMKIEKPGGFSSLYELHVHDASEIATRKIPGFSNLRSVYFYSSAPFGEPEVAKIQARNQRLLVYWRNGNQGKSLGGDPEKEAGIFLVQAGFELYGQRLFGEAPRLVTTTDLEQSTYVSKIIVGRQTPVNDRVLTALSRVSYFTSFEARSNRTPNRLLIALKGQCYLSTLILSDSALEDENLEDIGRIINLKTVDISRTKVTQSGVSALHRCLPRCRIICDFGIIEPDYESQPGLWK